VSHITVILFICTAIITFIPCLYAARLGEKLGVMDLPGADVGSHKGHTSPTPAVGGLILGIVALGVFWASMPWSGSHPHRAQEIRFVVAGVVITSMIIGFIDDKFNLKPLLRVFLFAALAAAFFLMLPIFSIERIYFPSGEISIYLGIYSIPFSMLCLVALNNAVNMADGRNGLVLGLALIWNGFFLFHALPYMIPTMAGVMGCLIVLFIFNLRGKLFLGDCGSYGIALYYGLLALILHRNAFGTVTSAEAVLLFLVPVLDTARLIVVRMASGQSPLMADKRHLHHMLDNAIGWYRGWFVYMALVAVPLVVYQITAGMGLPIIFGATVAYGVVVWTCSPRVRASELGN
jgi:UDP-GlcNAc:undecaprenyl-phosphate/decaprenyl-phosphate GlcNAc-1-phosphate transferase